MRNRWLLSGLVALAVVFPIGAAPPGQLIIVEAVPNSQTGIVTIVGINLGGSSAVVKLGGQTLSVQSATETQIVATLPSLPSGTYLLSVARGNAMIDQDTFSVALGAAAGGGGGGAGDIESVAVGTGLLGGGTSGEVSVSINPGYFDGNYARLDAPNHFLETQSIDGSLNINQIGDSSITVDINDHDPDQRVVQVNSAATTGCNGGVIVQMNSPCSVAVGGVAFHPDGGIGGGFESRGFNGIALQGFLAHPTGNGTALLARAVSPNAVAAEIVNDNGGIIINGVNGSQLVFQVLGDGTVVANNYVNWSSQRYKTNVTEIEGALATIEELRPVSFDWKATGKRDLGLIAEEVAVVVPDAVAFDDEGPRGIDYSGLTALLIEAVKEQQRQIRELERRLQALE